MTIASETLRTAKEYRLAQLTEALAVGAEYAGLRSVTFTRALEFLLDQQLDDGCVGIHQLLGGQGDSAPLTEAQGSIAELLTRIASALGRRARRVVGFRRNPWGSALRISEGFGWTPRRS